ncbi:NnrS family protein [Lampropedia puyangensis]|uniref:NnrS family protein n=1 Tax=Lampropedia puyangensis TaxID=1330072 RepID=A0A4S8EW09_9BURK|nr:NnrS family protein [Lampropedia puyangensis]THT98440.1 NnrS family protein [Lampropedia puyangensis]
MTELLHIQEPAPPRQAAPQWQAFWSMGFRPLYLLACLWSMGSVLAWVFVPELLVGWMPGVVWHAHEMIWGFVGSIAVGFLLTAAANWTGINPAQGRWLICLTGLWCIARVGFVLPGAFAFVFAALSECLFFCSAAWAIGSTIVKTRSQRNYAVIGLMLVLAATDAAYLLAVWQLDYEVWSRNIHAGMWCMALIAVLIGRRVIPFFASRAVANLQLPVLELSGHFQIAAGAIAIVATWLGQHMVSAAALAIVGGLACWQTCCWQPWRVWHIPLLWVLYVGYAALGLGLLVSAAHAIDWVPTAAWPLHVIGVLGFSVMIIGMVTRTALGHLGRPLRTDRSMVLTYSLVIAAGGLRLWALTGWPLSEWALQAAAIAWALAFGTYLWRFAPWLIRPRADAPGGTPVALNVRLERVSHKPATPPQKGAS